MSYEMICPFCGMYVYSARCCRMLGGPAGAQTKARKRTKPIESAGSPGRTVTNTARQDPMFQFLDALDGNVAASEERGQREVVEAMVLPSVMDKDTRAALIKAGVVLGEQVKGDKLFLNATLPTGWNRILENATAISGSRSRPVGWLYINGDENFSARK